MGEYIENHKAAHTQYKSITEEFQKDIGECLNQQGFGIIFNGSRRTIEPVLRARIPKSAREALNTRGDNIILSYPEGHLTASMKELTGVNPDMVYIIGEMNVTIAHKK
jgi:hypothetical protein